MSSFGELETVGERYRFLHDTMERDCLDRWLDSDLITYDGVLVYLRCPGGLQR